MPAAATNNAALLEKRLTLVTWFASVLGYNDNADMLRSLKEANEGWGKEYNYVLERWLTEKRAKDNNTLQTLQELDFTIRADWEAMNRKRDSDISLKYFQYLAVLASALFLRRLAESPQSLLQELQRFAYINHNLEKIPDIDSLYKLAFWMATGSGKTLLMHLHYKQFLRYRHSLFIPDNILLITPNEELSRQHITEMEISGIPCFRHSDNVSLLHSAPQAVRVIEITKLLHEQGKRGKGKGNGNSVYVEAFAGQNLIFVDEGHKGAGGEVWFKVRDKLAKNNDKRGFVFEYSATFGQALSAQLLSKIRPRDDKKVREYDRAQEYARSILFDYSYRYFYSDGYGKDFSVLGIKTEPTDEQSEQLLMLGNLLTFFEQQWLFAKNETALAPYQVEKPLQLLIGSTVTGKKGEENTLSDVRKILRFLQQVAADKTGKRRWLQQAIKKLFTGQSGMIDGNGKDLFAGCFQQLRDAFSDEQELAAELRKTLFYTETEGMLRFSVLKQAKGEAVLRIGNTPFALVYVGDINKLSQLVKQDGLETDIDAIQSSLFAAAHLPTSPLNILIGAKKFMEGWSSWRVSSMGLVDIGKTEGTEIIQLFGRGVRLRGQDFSLKRSTPHQRESIKNINAELSESLKAVERLNIFAIRADFMNKFRSYLENEGVLEETFSIKIRMMDGNLLKGKELHTLQFPPPEDFQEIVMLQHDENIKIKLDYSIRTQALSSRAGNMDISAGAAVTAGEKFPQEIISLLNFDSLHRRMLEYKYHQKRDNLLIERKHLAEILHKNCRVIGDDIFTIKGASAAKLHHLHHIAFTALRKYAEKLYYRRQKKWETTYIKYMPLFDSKNRPVADMRDNFTDYEIRVQNSEQRAEKILRLLEKEDVLYQLDSSGGNDGLLRVAFDRHLYMPLLLEEAGLTITPPGLNNSEEKFVKALKGYLNTETGKQMQPNIFLLRNAGKGKGVGFYEDEGFFPDFILWQKTGNRQRIIFIEPHGMLHSAAHDIDFKARLWKKLEKLTEQLQATKPKWKNISMDSYIISETPFDKLKNRYGNGKWPKEKFTANHILFAEDSNYLEHILSE